MTSVSFRRSCAAAITIVLASLSACGDSSDARVTGDEYGSGPPAPRDGGPRDGGDPDVLAPPDGAVDAGPSVRVRIMAANTTSGDAQVYEEPGIRIFQGLAPDVALVQEFNYPGDDRRALVDAAFGPEFDFYVEPRDDGIPNGIVSRYPIVASGVWADASTPDRALAYARIDIPGPIDLWAVSVHLLTSGAKQRDAEATQLLGYVQANVPSSEYLVVGGDFNTDDTIEPALVTLGAALEVTGPFPSDEDGNTNTSINRNHPHDYVFASPNLDERSTPVVIGETALPYGLVFDSRVYTALDDVAPILATDSSADGMQHMPVVRDFLVATP